MRNAGCGEAANWAADWRRCERLAGDAKRQTGKPSHPNLRWVRPDYKSVITNHAIQNYKWEDTKYLGKMQQNLELLITLIINIAIPKGTVRIKLTVLKL